MKKVFLLFCLLLPFVSCDKSPEEEELADLKEMVQAPHLEALPQDGSEDAPVR